MGGLSNSLAFLSCGDLTAGSLTTFCNDGGVSRLNVDQVPTGGAILGPGADDVFCDDLRVSIGNDSVAAHPPCPSPDHCAAFTLGSLDVTVQDPLLGGTGIDIPGLPDLRILSFFCTTPVISISPTLQVTYTGPLTFVGSFQNWSVVDLTEGFNIALFEIGSPAQPPNVSTLYNIQRSTVAQGVPVTLLQELRVPFINAGQLLSFTFVIPPSPSQLTVGIPRYFAMAIDIDNEVREAHEGNNTSLIVFAVAT